MGADVPFVTDLWLVGMEGHFLFGRRVKECFVLTDWGRCCRGRPFDCRLPLGGRCNGKRL